MLLVVLRLFGWTKGLGTLHFTQCFWTVQAYIGGKCLLNLFVVYVLWGAGVLLVKRDPDRVGLHIIASVHVTLLSGFPRSRIGVCI